MDAAYRVARPTPVRPTGYLVDGHELMRQGVRHLLELSGVDIIGESDGVADAIARIPGLRPNIVILECELPDGSGVTLCSEIRRADPGIRCLMLADRDDEQMLLQSIQSGADGYLPKGISPADLTKAVRHVALGGTLFSQDMLTRALGPMDLTSAPQSHVAGLSAQQQKVLSFLAEGMTNRQIAQKMYLTEKTVRNYVSILLAKLGFERRTQAAIFASRDTFRGHKMTG
jgi:two-component system response regulator DevR